MGVGADGSKEHLSTAATLLLYATLAAICALAFSIRLISVMRYESIIHEFDPYFNFRATKVLAHEGFFQFLNWMDNRSWYPLGRAVGGTVYPGLMVTAAVLYWIALAVGFPINIRNVCVFVAPIFSMLSSIASFLLTREVTKKSGAGLVAAAFTATVPSYISRSVGGSYDNEAVAIFALIFCFYLWIKAVHTGSIMWSCLCALAYFYMVASWGGYIFIINIIPIYVAIMLLAGRYSPRLYVAYSVFYVVGSLAAMTVPFVGFNVIDRAECAASHGMFIAVQLYALMSVLHQVIGDYFRTTVWRVLYVAFAVVVAAVAAFLIRMQLTGDLIWTGRSLTLLDPTYATKFIPIIASVSEHQPSTWTAYMFDLHVLVLLSPAGMLFLFYRDLKTDGAVFVLLYGSIAWYFAAIMVRLMLTLAPVACILSGIAVSYLLTRFSAIIKNNLWWTWYQWVCEDSTVISIRSTWKGRVSSSASIVVISGIYVMMLFYLFHCVFCANYAYSSPSIIVDGGVRPDGTPALLDDYREAYFWLRHNTAPDAKILSWWDYGYQLSAMANRTVLVDNNTWNNTHIATVGRVFASSEEKAFPILQSLDVDYVLVIFGGKVGQNSDDINKLMWPIRIGKGVFPNDIPEEGAFLDARSGGLNIGPEAPSTLQNCIAYKLCYFRFNEILEYSNGKAGGYDHARRQYIGSKKIELKTMEEAFTSENWIVRIYKVLKQPIFDSISISEHSALFNYKRADNTSTDSLKKPGTQATYIGCYSSEAFFESKIYGGQHIGANMDAGIGHAILNSKPYIAFASNDAGSGHAFAFKLFSQNSNSKKGDRPDAECSVTCDDVSTMSCGCADSACVVDKSKNEKNSRRWSVYQLSAASPIINAGK